ncbi:hypothetical protein LCGC14_1925500, partial [marine sediment metagenome]
LQAAIDQITTDIEADSGIDSERLGDYAYTLVEHYAQRHMGLLNTWKRLMA